MKRFQIVTGLLWLMSFQWSFGQGNQLESANQHYKLGEYTEAIPLFEAVISEKKDNLNARSKLAYCYKMMNRSEKAEELYASLARESKVRPTDLFYYGEVLMSNAKYDSAKIWFSQYLSLQPEDEKGRLLLEACDKVKTIRPLFPHISVKAFPQNSDGDDSSPVLFNNGVVFASDRDMGFQFLKQKSGTTGRDYIRLYFSEKQADGSYSKPVSFSAKLNELNKNTGNASFTADGKMVYFSRNSNVLSKNSAYNLQIFQADASGDSWKNVELLPFCTPEQNFMHPAISPDGLSIFFVSDRSGGEGGTDIYFSHKNSKGGWTRPENLGPLINTPANEGFPFMSANGNLYFCSKGHAGFGGFDIFVSQHLIDGTWTKPINVGIPINSTADDISIFLAPNDSSGVFTSSRNGGDDDIFLFDMTVDAPLPERADTAHAQQLPVVEKIDSSLSAAPAMKSNAERKTKTATIATPASEPVVMQFGEIPLPASLQTNASANPKQDTVALAKTEPPLIEPPKIEKKDTVVLAKPELPVIEPPKTEKKDTVVITKPEPPVIEPPKIEKKDTVVIAKPEPPVIEPPKIEKKDTVVIAKPEPPVIEQPKVEKKDTVALAKSEPPVIEPPKVETPDTVSIKQKEPEKRTAPEPKPDSSGIQQASIPVPPKEIPDSENYSNLYPGSWEEFKILLQTKQPMLGKHFLLNGLHYAPIQFTVTPDIAKILDKVAAVLILHPNLIVEVGSHTESTGNDDENLYISQQRAEIVVEYLVLKGVPPRQLNYKGYGETQPLNRCVNGVEGCTPEEISMNQRIVLKVTGE